MVDRMATAMFLIRRCFNISTSERPVGLLLAVLGVDSTKMDGDVEEDDGLEIETTSPNCAESAEDFFLRIGVDSPNWASGIADAVTFDVALVVDTESSRLILILSNSSWGESSVENNLRDRDRIEQDDSPNLVSLPAIVGIIRVDLFEEIMEDKEGA